MSMKSVKTCKAILVVASCLMVLSCLICRKEKASEMKHNLKTTVLLNEVCAKNLSVISSGDAYPHSYIELYNASDEIINLEGYALTTNLFPKKKSVLSDRVIEPNEYVLLFADVRLSEENPEILNLSLTNTPCTLFLLDDKEEVIDQLDIPYMETNAAYGRGGETEIDLCRMQTCTPYANNMYADILENKSLEAPEFSAESGFYKEGFLLEIYPREGEHIFYTLDGSEPNQNSLHYMEPVYIADASLNENKWSVRTDFSANKYYTPEALVDKATIIKAVTYDNDGNKSRTATAVYFVDAEVCKKYGKEIPVLSIVAEPDALFGYEDGILVLGEAYDSWIEELGEEPEDKVDYHINANFQKSGRKWERQCYINYFVDQQNVLGQMVGVRRRGKSSSTGMQKGFNLYARKIYDGNTRLQYNMFASEKLKKSVTLKRCETFPIEKLVLDLAEDGNAVFLKYEFVSLFLNGEYWGLYNITERYTPEYFEEYFGVPEENITIVKGDELIYGKTEDKDELDFLFEYAEKSEASSEEKYEYLCSKIDMDSFIDYYCFQIYNDAADCEERYNVMMWKASGVEERKKDTLADGKWHWGFYDNNSCLLDHTRNNITEQIRDGRSAFFSHKILSILLESEEFAERFVNRYLYLTEHNLDIDKVCQRIDELNSLIKAELENQCQRYGYENDLDSSTERIKAFYRKRNPYVLKYMLEYFENTEFDECKKILADKYRVFEGEIK